MRLAGLPGSQAFDVPKVRESYLAAAQRANGAFYPAGTAWQEAWKRDASLTLYAPMDCTPARQAVSSPRR